MLREHKIKWPELLGTNLKLLTDTQNKPPCAHNTPHCLHSFPAYKLWLWRENMEKYHHGIGGYWGYDCLELRAEISSCNTETTFFFLLSWGQYFTLQFLKTKGQRNITTSPPLIFCHTNPYSPHGFIPFPFKHQLLMNNGQVECVSYME